MNAAEDRRKAGIFLMISLGLLLALVGILAGVEILSQDKRYLVEFTESVSGLEPSSLVKYNGVPVGSVASIHFHPEYIEKIQVEIRVRQDVPVKMNTRATLKPQGITGVFFLELYGGTADAGEMPEGDIIPSDPGLGAAIGSIAKNLGELVERLNLFFATNEEDLTGIIGDLRASAGALRHALESVDELVVDGKAAVADVRTAVEDMRAEVKSAGEAFRRTTGELESLLADPELRAVPGKASAALDRVNRTLEGVDLRGLVERANLAVEEFRTIEASLDRAARALAETAEEGQEDVAAALSNIRAATENVKRLTRMLRDDPGRLLQSSPVVGKEIPDPPPPLPEDRR